MTAARLAQSILPRPRRRVSWGGAIPLVLFLALFIAGCAWAEWSGVLRFSRRPAFLLLLATPWIWWLHAAGSSGLAGARALIALITRLLLAGALILLLAEPRAVRRSDTLSVVYALDVSDSMGEKVSDDALGWVMQSVTAKPAKDEAGLVVFGRDAAVELPPRQTFPFEAINARVARDGTDLAKALSLAAAMLPEENQGRIVLISDGNETGGHVEKTLADLKARGIAVDVLPVQFAYENEVWLEHLDLPRAVKKGETYEAAVVLSSLKKGRGKLTLSENGKPIFEKEVEFDEGKNRYVLPLYLREPGYYEYAATIDVPKAEDGWRENNIAINDLYLKGEGKVLVVTDSSGDARDWETFVTALKAADRIVEIGSAYEFPRDAFSLMPYDAIIFPNVPADSFDPAQMQALRDAVYDQGIGFVMLGGPNSFGPGGYHRSPIEEALPVTMDIAQKKVLPKGALAVILHTCEFPEGNTWAKRIAKEAIRVLGAQDEVGVLAYLAQGDQWIFPLTPAREYERLALLINKAEPGDMPSFDPAMKLAFNALAASDAALKHMIIISDGDPSPPTPVLLQSMANAKISISTVAINPHGGQDAGVLQAIADATGGRYYFAQDPRQLPSIFVKEAKTLKRSMIQNKTFTPTIEFPSPILKGIDALPELTGYVLTSPKPRAKTILKGPETEQIDPVLATWRFGVGASAAFTSDLSPAWGAEWIGWDKYRAFVRQLITDISRVERPSELTMQTFAAGGSGIITIDDAAPRDSFLELQARVSGPRNETVTVPLKQTGPRRYQGEFPLWGKGRYTVLAAGAGAGRSERAVGGFAVPYSPEYLRFRSDPILLKKVAQETGGRLLTGRDDAIFKVARTPRESSRPVIDWFLILVACLIPIDVGVRRIQLDWSVIRGWFGFGKKEAASGETLGALLQRKQEVSATMETRRPAAPIRLAPKSNASQSSQEDVSPPAEEGESTTARLLARKRKRDEK